MNRVAELRFHTLHLPFRQRFSHAAASRNATSSLWVEAIGDDGTSGVGEACPRPYVTGETLDSAREFFRGVRAEVLDDIGDADSLRAWVARHSARIDSHPAAWCAIELALIDLLSREAGLTAEAWLGLPETAGVFRYSAVLGDAELPVFQAQLGRYLEAGMSDFKLKLSGDLTRDRARIAVLREAGAAVARLRLDANNLWRTAAAALDHLRALEAPAFAIEEPLVAAARAELPALARALGVAVILDESLLRREELGDYPPGTPWIANLRVSKLGGLLRALALVEAARARGMRVIVGAQVGETSLLSRVALPVAQAAGDGLIAQEGAFGERLLETDPCVPSLVFAAGGVLKYRATAPGWGLACAPATTALRS